MSEVEGLLKEEIALNERQQKEAREAALKEIIDVGREYAEMKKTAGWQRLEKEVLSRVAALTSRLHSQEGTLLYRAQGESLGIQSILSIVNAAIEDGEQASNENIEEE